MNASSTLWPMMAFLIATGSAFAGWKIGKSEGAPEPAAAAPTVLAEVKAAPCVSPEVSPLPAPDPAASPTAPSGEAIWGEQSSNTGAGNLTARQAQKP